MYVGRELYNMQACQGLGSCSSTNVVTMSSGLLELTLRTYPEKTTCVSKKGRGGKWDGVQKPCHTKPMAS